MKVLVPFSAGFEEIELVTVVDVLRRAGAEVTLASLDGFEAVGRSKIALRPDEALAVAGPKTWDAVILPGGLSNARTLQANALVREVVTRTANNGGLIAAICAAPVALAAFGLIGDREVTCYPGRESHIIWHAPEAKIVERPVVVADGVVTGRGPGTSMAFALELVGVLFGQDVVQTVRGELIA